MLSGAQEKLIFWKWKYWNKGISTKLFREEYLRDIQDVIDIDDAISERNLREKKLKQMLANIR